MFVVLGEFILASEGMRGNEVAGLGIHALDVRLELIDFNAPLTPAADLDRREFTRTHERVRLRGRDIQGLGDIRQRQEAFGHRCIVPNVAAKMKYLWITIGPEPGCAVMLPA